MAEGYKSRHTGAAIDNAIDRVERVPAAENDKYLHINASGEPEWSSIVVDDAMSSSSENPVQNKVVKSYVDSLASTALQRKIVAALPVQDIEMNVVYMILKQDGEAGDFYNEYMYINNQWELIGSTQMKVDGALSLVSENPVQNKVVTAALNEKLSKAEFEELSDDLELSSERIPGGSNLGSITINEDVWNIPEVVVDDELSDVSENPVQNKVVKAAIDAHTIPIDSEISAVSENPVQNKVIKAALDLKLSKEEFEEFADEFELSATKVSGAPDLGSITVGEDSWNIPEIVVDDALSDVSENPVQNKVVKAAIDAHTIPVDSEISAVSENPVQNKVIKAALDLKLSKEEFEQFSESFTMSTERVQGGSDLGSITIGEDSWNIPNPPAITVDDEMSDVSENPVQNKVVKAALDAQKVSVDSALSASSENPVQNKVIKAALDLKANASEIDPLSLTVSTTRSSDPSALNAQSFTLDDGTTETIYNLPQEVVVDDALSASSENPVQNKVVKAALDLKANASEINAMSVVFSDSKSSASGAIELKSFTVTQGGVDTIYNLPEGGVVDSEMSSTSENPVQNKVIYAALQNVPSTTDVQSMIDTAIQGAINSNY